MKNLIKRIDKNVFNNFFAKLISKYSFFSLYNSNDYFDGTTVMKYKILDSLELNQHFEKYGSDKGHVNNTTRSWPPHNFADIYSFLFGSRRYEIKKYLKWVSGLMTYRCRQTWAVMGQVELV